MAHHHTSTVDSDISFFTNSLPPPPPYSVSGNPVDARPRLPEVKRNALLNACMLAWSWLVTLANVPVPADSHVVKFQTIVRDGREIVVGRVKVPTVSAAEVAQAHIPARQPHPCFHSTSIRYQRYIAHYNVQGGFSRCYGRRRIKRDGLGGCRPRGSVEADSVGEKDFRY